MMAASYKVEFILEDWMIDGLKSGKYMIKSGNLLEAQSHQVVKWLNIAHILPPDGVEGMLENAIDLARSACSITTANLVMSAVNLVVGVAIYQKLDSIENQIDRCIKQLQQLFDRVNDIHEELIRGLSLYPILQGFELFDRASLLSNREHLYESAQIELIKGMASASYWLQTRSRSELLEHLNLVEDISIALMKAAITEAQILRILERSPVETALIYPFEKALGIIDYLEGELNKEGLPRSAEERQGIQRREDIFKINEALKITANESLNLQLALIQGQTDIIEIDRTAKKARCLVHAPTRRDILPPAT